MKKPTPKIGDVVFADGSWFTVTQKAGQRLHGRLLCPRRLPPNRGLGSVLVEYPFTSRRVERVFRELGKRTPPPRSA